MSQRVLLKDLTLLSLDETLVYMEIASATLLRYRAIEDFPKTITVMGKQYFIREELDRWCYAYRRDYRHEIFDKEKLKEKLLLTRREARFYTGISDTTVIRHIDRGTFPQPVYLFRRTFFNRTELDEWLTKYERGKPIQGPEQ